MTTEVERLTAEFQALRHPDPWRPAFDQWALARGLSAEQRRAVVILILRERVFHAVERSSRRTARGRR